MPTTTPSSHKVAPSVPGVWGRWRARARRVMERYGFAPRLQASAWDAAETPVAVQDLLFRRAGATSLEGWLADAETLAVACERARGWTPDLLRRALRPRGLANGPALIANPALTVACLAILCESTDTRCSDYETWLPPLLDRVRGPNPPRGWSADPSAWTPVLRICLEADFRRRVHDDRTNPYTSRFVRSLTARPDMTDEDLAALLAAMISAPVHDALAAVLAHPLAGPATRQVLCHHVQSVWGAHEDLWCTVASARAEWLQDTAVRAALSARVPHITCASWRIFLAHAEPAVVAAAWQAAFADYLPVALASLVYVPTDALRLIPPLSAHDIEQCLAHAPSASVRVGLLAALAVWPMVDPPTPPAVAVPNPPESTLAPPMTPSHLAAHDPTLRTWLAEHTPAHEAHITARWSSRKRNARRKREEMVRKLLG